MFPQERVCYCSQYYISFFLLPNYFFFSSLKIRVLKSKTNVWIVTVHICASNSFSPVSDIPFETMINVIINWYSTAYIIFAIQCILSTDILLYLYAMCTIDYTTPFDEINSMFSIHDTISIIELELGFKILIFRLNIRF